MDSSKISCKEAVRIAAEVYGLEADASDLPSYADQNFALAGPRGRHVLKVARASASREELDLENRIMQTLEARGIPSPRVLPSIGGEHLTPLELAGERRFVRLVTWLDGIPLAELAAPATSTFEEVGHLLARIDEALLNVDHPAARRELSWDLRRAHEMRSAANRHLEGDRRKRVAGILEGFDEDMLPRLDGVRESLIHNDANDYNIMVTPRGDVVGLIDFGDALTCATVAEVAIALAYAMLSKSDPLEPASALLRGYCQVLPLTDAEVRMLPGLVQARLAVSVSSSARERALHPDNEYVSVTEPHAWKLLDWFENADPGKILAAFQTACAASIQ